MMTRDFRDKWTAKLRSGEYKQGRGVLQSTNNRFCCLGVALETAGVKADPVRRDYLGHYTTLPYAVRDDLGIDVPLQDQLATMNDIDRASFIEIADYLDSLPVID